MDSFTHNLVQSFLKLGAPVVVLRIDKIDLETLTNNLGSYLVLSPGPGTPSDYPQLMTIIKNHGTKIPILGVCLGFQAINEYYGGRTIRSDEIIHGKSVEITHDQTGIFEGIPSPTSVARYHSLRIHSYPSKLQIQSEYRGIPMAFSIRSHNIAGIQFHPESFLTPHGELILKNFLDGKI